MGQRSLAPPTTTLLLWKVDFTLRFESAGSRGGTGGISANAAKLAVDHDLSDR
jgi:hypothetical protein